MKKTGVLDGVRIIEVGTFITGPAAGVLLADLGADVIKVEKPGSGDPFRRSEDGSLYDPNFQAFNRNKKSISLDTTCAEDLAILDQLVAGADIFIQNFRPGVADRLNLGEQRLRSLNERLIYCSISGFGFDGPDSNRPCYDTIAQAVSGYLDLTLNPENPRVLGPAVADSLTGFYAAYGILGALYERTLSQKGKSVDVSMLGAMMHFNIDSFTHYFASGERMHPYSRPGASQAHVLNCQDGKRIALHMSSPPKFWENLVKAIDYPELRNDPRFATREQRIIHHTELIELLDKLFRCKPSEEWCERLCEFDVPYALVNDAPSVLHDPQVKHMQMQLTTEHPVNGTFRAIRNPVIYNKQFTSTLNAAPLLDEHRQEIITQLKKSI